MPSVEFEDVVAVFRARAWPDHALDMEDIAVAELRKVGFAVSRKIPCPYLSETGVARDGSISMGVERNGKLVAIEIDNWEPRHRSIAKLRLFRGETLIVIRPDPSYVIPIVKGITRIIGVDFLRHVAPRTTLYHARQEQRGSFIKRTRFHGARQAINKIMR